MNLSGPQSIFRHQSGRIISFGRVMLSSLFLISIWFDQSQPKEPTQTYSLLVLYIVFAVSLAAVTWRSWWLDARLAAPAHLVDMAMFTAIVFSTNGYTSPFFLFFILPLLAAAIRWGWRETMVTATMLILLYMSAGLLVARTQAFELERFIVRSGHLFILSAVLIWFGIHQRFTRLFVGADELDRQLGRDEDPLANALRLAMGATIARSGALVMRTSDERSFSGVAMIEGALRPVTLEDSVVREAGVDVVLFDMRKNRSLTIRSNGWYRFVPARRLIDSEALDRLGAVEGLVTQVRSGTQQGWLILWDIADQSADYVELGPELGRAAGTIIDNHALLSAIEEGAAARTRLSLARDVHDSVVQFLAGATIRVEAIMRSRPEGQVQSDLKELKRLLIEEQGEIRALVSALRRDRELELAESVEELKTLAMRLGRQWSVDCQVNASNDPASVPIEVQLELQQLLREAVANAVRHGGASRIDIDVGVDEDQLRLQVTDNGSGFVAANGAAPVEPWSLKERVDRAHGSLSLRSHRGCTDVVITLPLTGVPG